MPWILFRSTRYRIRSSQSKASTSTGSNSPFVWSTSSINKPTTPKVSSTKTHSSRTSHSLAQSSSKLAPKQSSQSVPSRWSTNSHTAGTLQASRSSSTTTSSDPKESSTTPKPWPQERSDWRKARPDEERKGLVGNPKEPRGSNRLSTSRTNQWLNP